MGIFGDIGGALKKYTPQGQFYTHVTQPLIGDVKGAVTPAKANLGPAQQAQQYDFGLTQGIGNQRAGFFGPPQTAARPRGFLGGLLAGPSDQSSGGGAGTGGPTAETGQAQQEQIRAMQLGALSNLTAAANGKVPSAAELQAKQQANRAAAQQFGMAAALQGRSPGGALSQALTGAEQTQADANASNAILRANEQATARGQLAGALQGTRGQDIGVTGQQLDEYNTLLNAQLQGAGLATNAGIGYANASAQQAASTNAFKGGLLQGAGQLGIAAMSDEREKTDIKSAGPGELRDLFHEIEPSTFEYKNPAHGRGARIGVMAQDVAKSKLGSQIVVGDRPMRLDVSNSIGAALAGMADLNRRMEKLEQRTA